MLRHDHIAVAFHVLRTTSINTSRLVKSVVWDWLPFKFFLCLYVGVVYNQQIQTALDIVSCQNSWIQVFAVLFLFKYIKVVVHTISFLLYRPYPIPRYPTVTSRDVTVIIPTVGEIDEPEFRETLKTILANFPAQIIVSTVGKKKLSLARRVCEEELAKHAAILPSRTKIRTVSVDTASKRLQVFEALQAVRTSIVCLADDHVFWGERFLAASLAPFEDPQIGGVGTNKRVRRHPFKFSFPNFLNFTACNYLERHNFECTASVNIDKGAFVLSGRTVLYRTSILHHPRFEKEYLRETWFFGLVGKGGFNVDDDVLVTRFTFGVAKYKLWFQNCPDSTMHTTLGEPHKFFKQMDRWIRTGWRSHSTCLFSDQTVWKTQPWSVYAVYLSSFVNLALFYDASLLTSLWFGLENGLGESTYQYKLQTSDTRQLALSHTHCGSTFHHMSSSSIFLNINRATAMWALAMLLFATKMIKPLPHFWRNPRDTLYIPFYVLFGYYHSFIKLKALLTVWVISWGSRPGVQ